MTLGPLDGKTFFFCKATLLADQQTKAGIENGLIINERREKKGPREKANGRTPSFQYAVGRKLELKTQQEGASGFGLEIVLEEQPTCKMQ